MKPLYQCIVWFFMLFSLSAGAQTAVIDSLQKIIAQNKRDSVEASALVALANEYTRTDIQKAKQVLYHCVALARAIQVNTPLSSAYTVLVNLQTDGGHIDSARYYLDLMQTLAVAHPGTNIEANYNFAAGEFYKKTGEFKKSIPFIKKAIQVYTLLDNKVQTAGLTLNLGNAYLSMGLFKEALDCHLQALRLFEALGNKRGQSFCYQSVGSDLLNISQYKEALSYIRKGLAIKQELNDKRGTGTALMALGQIYTNMKEYDTALQYVRQAMQINDELKILPEQAVGYYRLGDIYEGKQDLKTSVEYFEKANMFFLQLKDSARAANARVRITQLELTANKQQKTAHGLFSSLNTSVEKGDHYTEANSYKTLSAFYAADKQYEKAFAYMEKFHGINDSMTGNTLKLQLKALEKQYNLEKKEQEINIKVKEIALLKKDQQLRAIELQKERTVKAGALVLAALLVAIALLTVNRYRVIQKAKRIIEIEKLRNDIARDLHDDIGSALSSININSNMALNRAGEQAVVQTQLEKIKNNSGKIMESMSDIVWAINPGNDSMENLLIRMKEFLAEILEPLNINYSLDEKESLKKLKLSVDKRKEIYLVFKEAVNNAAKYSHCKNIAVILSGIGPELELQVNDDGNGFDAQTRAGGNGLRNMRQRALNMGGQIALNTHPGKGTKLQLKIPVT